MEARNIRLNWTRSAVMALAVVTFGAAGCSSTKDDTGSADGNQAVGTQAIPETAVNTPTMFAPFGASASNVNALPGQGSVPTAGQVQGALKALSAGDKAALAGAAQKADADYTATLAANLLQIADKDADLKSLVKAYLAVVKSGKSADFTASTKSIVPKPSGTKEFLDQQVALIAMLTRISAVTASASGSGAPSLSDFPGDANAVQKQLDGLAISIRDDSPTKPAQVPDQVSGADNLYYSVAIVSQLGVSANITSAFKGLGSTNLSGTVAKIISGLGIKDAGGTGAGDGKSGANGDANCSISIQTTTIAQGTSLKTAANSTLTTAGTAGPGDSDASKNDASQLAYVTNAFRSAATRAGVPVAEIASAIVDITKNWGTAATAVKQSLVSAFSLTTVAVLVDASGLMKADGSPDHAVGLATTGDDLSIIRTIVLYLLAMTFLFGS